MAVSAEMYIVISLMFAVFAAVAAVGTSVVLGVGFERLRAGFEIVKKQTGFFADAIHKLDERADILDAEQGEIKKSVASMHGRVDKVEKQTGFFFESLNSLESQILEGRPAEAVEPAVEQEIEKEPRKKSALPQVMEWTATSEAKSLLQARQQREEMIPAEEEETTHSLTSSLFNYLLNDNGESHRNGVVYH